MSDEKIGFLLEHKRKDLDLSIRKAAEIIGISHTYLSNLEKGIDPRTGAPIKPTPETLSLISKAYDIEYDVLMEMAGYIEKRNPDIRNPHIYSINTQEEANSLAGEIFQILIDTGELSKEEVESGEIDIDKKNSLLKKIKKSIKASQLFEE